MNEDENCFDIFADDEVQPIEKSAKTQNDETLVVEALQVVRIVKQTVGKNRREVLDTILVSYPSMTYERALKIAKHKAKVLGNCMVVEKLERVIDL